MNKMDWTQTCITSIQAEANIISTPKEKEKNTIISKKDLSESQSKLEKQVIKIVDQKLSTSENHTSSETNINFDIQEMIEAGWGFGC